MLQYSKLRSTLCPHCCSLLVAMSIVVVPILGIIRNITSVFTLCNDCCIRVPILGIIRNISVFTLHNDYCSRVSIFAIIRNIISVFTLQKRILLEKPNKLSNINKLPKLIQQWMMQSLEIYLL